jgi:hypothetical protein
MEDNPQPTPTTEKKKQITWSTKPKEDFREWFQKLIEEKGGISQAVDHCIRFTMTGAAAPKPAPAPAPKPEPKPAPVPVKGYTPDEKRSMVLQRLMKSKKTLQTETQAIDFCIDYTKDDYL